MAKTPTRPKRPRRTPLPAWHPSRLDPKTARSLALYLGIGTFVFVIDVGSFQLLLMAGMGSTLAVTLSFALAIVLHFNLNRFLNFKSFERSILHQLKTYLIVIFVCWMITILVIQTGVSWFGLSPVMAKVLAVAINVPIGFLGHRYLSFGQGLRARFRTWYESRRS